MQSRGASSGWLIHLAAGMALGAAVVLVVWIVSGGQPFGRIIGSDDVSEPTTAAAKATAAELRAVSSARKSARLGARPPAVVKAPELRFMEPKAGRANAKAKAERARRAARAGARKRAARPKRRSPVVRVVAPPQDNSGETVDAPVAAVPEPAPTAAPKPAAPPPGNGAGGGSAKPSPPGPTYWVGEG